MCLVSAIVSVEMSSVNNLVYILTVYLGNEVINTFIQYYKS